MNNKQLVPYQHIGEPEDITQAEAETLLLASAEAAVPKRKAAPRKSAAKPRKVAAKSKSPPAA